MTTPRSRNVLARLVGAPLFWVAAVGLLFGVPIARSVTRKLTAAPAVLGRLPAFSLTDQTGRSFGTRELEGKVWVADFIFTSCQQACPMLSARMAEIGRRARHLGPDFHLVSISVDPQRDTPARLAEYGARFGANPASWTLLTGPADAIQRAVTDGFKIGFERAPAAATDGGGGAAADPNAGFFDIFHGERLVLVDRQLRIRGYFEATPEGLDLLMEAIGRVVNA